MRKVLILVFINLFLFANSVNEELLYIEAKLYPKIIMLIQNLSQKPILKVAIVTTKQTINEAKKLKKFFPKNKKFQIDILNKITDKYDVYIFTYVPKLKNVKNLVKMKKILFTIVPNTAKNVMFGIYIGVRVYPYINPVFLKKANLQINPILFKVGKIYEK